VIPWYILAALCFVCALLFPTVFIGLDSPLQDFADKDRQAGLQQPTALLKANQVQEAEYDEKHVV